MSGEPEPGGEDERRRNRPYRRFVRIVFMAILIALSGAVLRGIVAHLDRLPSVNPHDKPAHVDNRALRACAEDLERLEAQIRQAAGRAFAAPPPKDERKDENRDENRDESPPPSTWETQAQAFEIERLKIIARCRLDESSQDAVASDLADAASAIESLLRSYSLLYARHEKDGLGAERDAGDALARALTALHAR